jgi:hypothetical protein
LSSPHLQEPINVRHHAASPSERKRLLSLAYGYFGSLVEAKDTVEEALLRLEQSDPASIQNVEAWLTTVVTRLSIDKLHSALRPVYGADCITRFFLGLLRKHGKVFDVRPATVNSGPGMLTFRDGLVSVAYVSIQDDRITAIYSVNNPDKIYADSVLLQRE